MTRGVESLAQLDDEAVPNIGEPRHCDASGRFGADDPNARNIGSCADDVRVRRNAQPNTDVNRAVESRVSGDLASLPIRVTLHVSV
jgi:hypothetical protein